MFEGELGHLNCIKEFSETINLGGVNRIHHVAIVVGLRDFHVNTSACHRQNTDSILRVLVKFEINDVVRCVLLTFPAAGREVSIAIVLAVVHE